jgi:hypothetical protein
MNDSMSILLATTILALGGLGLYMYKSSDDNQKEKNIDEEYDEGSLFGGNFWGSKEEDDDKLDEDYDDEEDFKPRKKNSTKTQKNRKSTGSSKRRY